MTRDELLASLDRRATEAEEVGATAPVATVIRQIKALVDSLDGVPAAPPLSSGPDRLLSVEEAAQRLNVTARWVYDNHERLPFLRKLSHRQLRASEKGLERWLARR